MYNFLKVNIKHSRAYPQEKRVNQRLTKLGEGKYPTWGNSSHPPLLQRRKKKLRNTSEGHSPRHTTPWKTELWPQHYWTFPLLPHLTTRSLKPTDSSKHNGWQIFIFPYICMKTNQDRDSRKWYTLLPVRGQQAKTRVNGESS